MNHFLVDKVLVADNVATGWINDNVSLLVVLIKNPVTAISCSFLVEDHVKKLSIYLGVPAKGSEMTIKSREVFFGFGL
jgi:hypothetical protein